MRAAVYARLSQDRSEDSVSVDDQIAACRERCDREGWDVVAEFQDRNISASVKKTRPGYDALLAAIREGRIDAVVVRETSRLYRRPAQLEELIDLLEERPVRFTSLFQGHIDLATPAGRMVARILAATDKAETERLGERVRLAKAARRAEGRRNGGGRRPYGYEKDTMRIVPAERRVIRDCVRRVLAGEPLVRIATRLRDAGTVTARGHPWRPGPLRRTLTGRILLGGADWPAILTDDEHHAVRAALESRSRKPTGRRRRYPLSGILRCGECGSGMLGSGGYYRCAAIAGGCGRVGVKAPPAEFWLDGEIQRRRETGLARDPGVAATAEPATGEALAELAAVDARIGEIQDAIAEGKFALEDVRGAMDGLARRREAAAKKLAASQPRAAWWLNWEVPRDWRRRWEAGELTDTEVADLAEVFAAYVEKATVAPARIRGKFEPERISVVWR